MAKIFSVDSVDAFMTRSIPPLVVVNASGRSNTLGWKDPRLEPRVYIVPPPDGIMDLDFVATPPQGITLPALGTLSTSISFEKPNWCTGIRVHASINHLDATLYPVLFDPLADKELAQFSEGDSFIPVPMGIDTFPWQIALLFQEAVAQNDRAESQNADDLKDPIESLFGKAVRVIQEGSPVTTDHQPERFNIIVKNGVIRRVFFG